MRRKYKTHRSRITTSGRMRKLWDRLHALGFRRFTLHWEPMSRAIEMCGYGGGYMLVECEREITPLGHSLTAALHGADSHAAYVRAFHPDRLAGDA